MRIAVLGDIHANLEALEAVIADLGEVRPHMVYCTGDIVGYGANPSECLDRVRELGWPVVMGNWEQIVAGVGDTAEEMFNPEAGMSLGWTTGALTLEQKDYLLKLPESIIEHGIQIVHGSPQPDRVTRYVLTEEDATQALLVAEALTVFIGHTHDPGVYVLDEPVTFQKAPHVELPRGVTALVNVGSVGQPRDSDPRACYCLYGTESRNVKLRRVKYDRDAAAGKIRAAGLPEKHARRLIVGE
jgi:diadenosine tetraphosphatase ApaH/serine/threonine PP2A family protein phosphatase